jgi:hypothetical protein
VSSTSARHRKPPRHSSSTSAGLASPGRRTHHRKPSAVTAVLRSRPAQIGVVATVGAAVIAVPALQAVRHLSGQARPAAMYQVGADSLARSQRPGDRIASPLPSASRSPQAAPTPSRTAPASTAAPHSAPAAVTPSASAQSGAAQSVYRNPLRSVSGLLPERVDMGADFGGSGPVYALGDAVITNATSDSAGWPGGGWITYQLTSGPAAGQEVYLAEDVQPTVSVGQQVTSSTVIANMFNGSAGIETGWAQSAGSSAESQLPAAGGISGGGPFPTEVGLNFDALLQELGVPAAENWGQSGFGVLPSGYPANWAAVLKP